MNNMIHSKSVKTRMFVSVSFNLIRAIITFSTGLLLARNLGPSGYGDLMFLLGSFMAIRSLLDMGSSNAFYTFISRKKRTHRFHLYYFIWLVLQFLITLSFVLLLGTGDYFEKIWLGHTSYIVILALLATFMQERIWQTIGQIGEASRQTGKVQILNFSVAISYLSIVLFLSIGGWISVENVLLILIGQYAIATFIAFCYFDRYYISDEKNVSFNQNMAEYVIYCKPLVILSLISFLYEFADKWLLQRYGGSIQQGYFQTAFLFSGVALLVTTSVLNVFWKELSEAWEKEQFDRAKELYLRVSRGLFILAAIIAGFLFPWAKEIVTVMLGKAYIESWPVLAVMFVYPVYQSLGQVTGTMLLATGHTQRFMQISSFIMFLSLPLAYFILAPNHNSILSGLGLGAIGLAIKMVLLAIVAVNLKSWIIAQYTDWEFDWVFQLVGLPLVFCLGYLSKTLIASAFVVNGSNNTIDLAISFMLTGLLYVLFIGVLLWRVPGLAGLKRSDILQLFEKFAVKTDKTINKENK